MLRMATLYSKTCNLESKTAILQIYRLEQRLLNLIS
jgi:hypothetical protein